MGSPEHRIEVDGVWKVFGDRPERVFQPEYASMSRTEIQGDLGVVVGLRGRLVQGGRRADLRRHGVVRQRANRLWCAVSPGS